MQLHILGSRGSFPTFGAEFAEFGHDTSCYVLRDGDYGLILDCGSGLSHASEYLADCKKIDVLLSHVHFDHILGLLDIDSFFDGKAVSFYGEFSAWVDAERAGSPTLFQIENLIHGFMNDVTLGKKFSLSNGFSVRFVRSLHPNSTCMIDVWQHDKHLCYTGDYEHEASFPICEWAKDCDLLLFDGSYNSENYPHFRRWGHSTWEAACQVAQACGAKSLVVTHHAAHSTDNYLRIQEQAAKKLFPSVTFARQGAVIEI